MNAFLHALLLPLNEGGWAGASQSVTTPRILDQGDNRLFCHRSDQNTTALRLRRQLPAPSPARLFPRHCRIATTSNVAQRSQGYQAGRRGAVGEGSDPRGRCGSQLRRGNQNNLEPELRAGGKEQYGLLGGFYSCLRRASSSPCSPYVTSSCPSPSVQSLRRLAPGFPRPCSVSVAPLLQTVCCCWK